MHEPSAEGLCQRAVAAWCLWTRLQSQLQPPALLLKVWLAVGVYVRADTQACVHVNSTAESKSETWQHGVLSEAAVAAAVASTA